MDNQEHMKIGRYHSWIENGTLKLYGHQVGASSGTFCSLDAAEAMGLLEMLARHREDINHALYVNEREHTLHSHAATR